MAAIADRDEEDLQMDGHARSRRKAVKVAVGVLCTEAGFGMAEESALETLTEMLQGLLSEIGRSAKAYTELSGRTEVLVTDLVMALVDLGINVESLQAHAFRSNKSVFIPPGQTAPSATQKVLSAGKKQDHPTHIPDYLPAFPDPHTYIRTDTIRQPVTEYQLIREKAASQKRDVERALTRFMAKTGDTQSLFKDDSSLFPLIAITTQPQPYINALLPRDQALECQENQDHEPRDDSTQNKSDVSDIDGIDNPYLLPVKMPRYKKRKFNGC